MNCWTRWACVLILASGLLAFYGVPAYKLTLVVATACSYMGLALACERAVRHAP